MRCADNREIVMHHYAQLELEVEGTLASNSMLWPQTLAVLLGRLSLLGSGMWMFDLVSNSLGSM